MKVKKLLLFCFSVLLVLLPSSLGSVAATKAIVYGASVNTSPNSIFFVPVSIKNNTGIMGFKISVRYDANQLSFPVVTRGTVCEGGMFNDSIGVTENGTFDIVWSSDSETSADGTLFVLSFNVDAPTVSETVLKFTYSQEDTFDEEYNDVMIECKDILISFSEESVSPVYSGEVKEPDYSDVLVSVDSQLKQMQLDSIGFVDDDFASEFLKEINDSLYIMTGTKDYFESADEIKGAYKAAKGTDFVKTSCDAVNPQTIDEIINNALKTVGAEDLNKITDDKKADFVKEVESKLSEQASDIGAISDVLTDDEALEVISNLAQQNEENQSLGKKVKDMSAKVDVKIISVIITAIVLIILISVIIKVIVKRKQKKHKEAK